MFRQIATISTTAALAMLVTVAPAQAEDDAATTSVGQRTADIVPLDFDLSTFAAMHAEHREAAAMAAGDYNDGDAYRLGEAPTGYSVESRNPFDRAPQPMFATSAAEQGTGVPAVTGDRAPFGAHSSQLTGAYQANFPENRSVSLQFGF